MTPDALKDKVQEGIREARPEEAIRIFREYAQENGLTDLLNTLLLLEARFHRLQQDRIRGIISSESAALTYAQIISGVLDSLNRVPSGMGGPDARDKTTPNPNAQETRFQEPVSPAAPAATKIFISYSHSDNTTHGDWIEKFKERLGEDYQSRYGKQLDIFFDRQDIRTGNVLSKKIGEALAQTALFIPIMTPAYLASRWCRREFLDFKNSAGDQLIVGTTSRILPIRLMPWEHFIPEENAATEVNDIRHFLEGIIYKNFYQDPLPLETSHSDFISEIGELSKEIGEVLGGMNQSTNSDPLDRHRSPQTPSTGGNANTIIVSGDGNIVNQDVSGEIKITGKKKSYKS